MKKKKFSRRLRKLIKELGKLDEKVSELFILYESGNYGRLVEVGRKMGLSEEDLDELRDIEERVKEKDMEIIVGLYILKRMEIFGKYLGANIKEFLEKIYTSEEKY